MVSPAAAQVPLQKTQAQNLRIGSSPAGLDLLPVLSHYSVLVHANYKDTLAAAIDLRLDDGQRHAGQRCFMGSRPIRRLMEPWRDRNSVPGNANPPSF